MQILKTLLLFFIIFHSLVLNAEIKVMTINTEWLWTPFDKRVDGNIKRIRDMSEKEYLSEIQFYAEIITARNIDIVALSEIENETVAHDISKALGKDWRTYFKQGRDTATGQDVALISRLDYVEDSLTDFGFPSGFLAGTGKAKRLSKLVGAQFWYPNKNEIKNKTYKVGVITSHFLSKRNENKHKALNRQKQAIALTKTIDKFRENSQQLIVLGDFNDNYKSETLKTLLQHDLQGFDVCDNFQDKGLNNQNKRWLRHIDHILFSGFRCLAQYKVDLQKHSDHDAIYAELIIPQAK